MQRGMLRGMAAFRWGAWVWLAVVMLLNRDDLARPWLAWADRQVGARVDSGGDGARRTIARNARTPRCHLLRARDRNAARRRGRRRVSRTRPMSSEAFSSVRTIGFAWPLVGIISAGVVFGAAGGLLAGFAVALPRWFAPVINGVGFDDYHGGALVLAGFDDAAVLRSPAASRATWRACLRKRRERSRRSARARRRRTNVARRRAADAGRHRAARRRPARSRAWPASRSATCASSCSAVDRRPRPRRRRRSASRAAAARFEDAFGGRVDVVLAPDLPTLEAAARRRAGGRGRRSAR